MNANPDSPARRRRRVRTWQVLALWLALMAPLATWGLPTARDDVFLFPDGDVWPPERYAATEAAELRRTRLAGADTDLNPLLVTDEIVHLTADDAGRAEILRRYRLYSRQPDEMITFMALQRMDLRQPDLDPRLYQYCGGYIYLVGAALAASAVAGFTTITADINFYLAQPEQFARFYLVARGLTLLFGAGLLAAAVLLARQAAGRTAGWIALALVAASPVFLSGVLEAKPHLPSVCMLLWATLAAVKFVTHLRGRDALRMGLFSGAALSLVLTGAAAALLWPMALLAGARRGEQPAALRNFPWTPLLIAAAVALAVYAVTNPYLVYNALFNQAALASNLANSTAMYRVGAFGAGLWRVTVLLVESVGLGAIVLGAIGAGWLLRRERWPTLVAAAPAVGMLLLCVAIGAGKPAEFARFLLLPGVLLCVTAGVALGRLADEHPMFAGALTVVALLMMNTAAYVRAFAADVSWTNESRREAAVYLQERLYKNDAIALIQEPAPYSIPPLDFARRDVYLLPPREPADLDVAQLPRWLVFTADKDMAHFDAWWLISYYSPKASFPADYHSVAPITWANKLTWVYRRVE